MPSGDIWLELEFGDDVWLTLTYDDGLGVPDPAPPAMGSCGDELYAAMEPLAYADHEHGWTLAHLCEGIGRMRQSISDLVRDSDEGPGWSAPLDVDRAPGAGAETDFLPFLAQLVGVRGIEGLDDAQRRAAIRERGAFRRGTPAAILSYATRFTDGTPGAVTLRERYDPRLGIGVDAPYHGQVRIKRSRLLAGIDEADLRARVLARVPAGLIFDVEITDDLDYDDVLTGFDDYDDLETRATDYDDLLSG
jgi:hypothetical protein